MSDMQIDNENMSNQCCKSQERYLKEKSQNGGGPTKIDESHGTRALATRRHSAALGCSHRHSAQPLPITISRTPSLFTIQ